MENNKEQQNQETPIKHRGKIEALDHLSLGISMVVAVALGIGIGLLLKSWTGYTWMLWLGVFWGIAAAILNVKKAYDKAKKDLDKLAQDPKYKYAMEHGLKDKKDDD
jgi:F0F1-type ATP synthase assembly protein I